MSDKKLLGEPRRQAILEWLKASVKAVKGSDLAQRTNVSRQVIVQDISLLKARGEPLIATSDGYLYLQQQPAVTHIEQVIVCHHQGEDTRKELEIIVNAGCHVKDVTIMHALYGEIVARLEIATIEEVDEFVKRSAKQNASYLLELTGGLHLHTIASMHQRCIDQACVQLREAGILIEEE
ncbi:transcription repressor NadR [Aureibacillus halotolerans]|uniref:Transcriptional regulator n=1 Tax=Aureibacillus halotolerans TaxID=1508390 RepID=A0A4R6U104_9BACI|nr:transcription repressor NadR [Aureibacillus halotolerans]TDQ37975.1 hypothetical protein EV213_11154 [Aureibacillus halotolerans]